MMISKRTKFLILIGLIILSAGIISAFSTGLRTDPTPPEVSAGWYLPQQDIVWTTSEHGTNQSMNEHLVLSGWRNGPAPRFPDLSRYCRYENFTQQDTDREYMIAVWYFNEDSRFLASRKNLEDFLNATGKITTVELNYSSVITAEDHYGQTNRDSRNNGHVPVSLIATGYESAATTGLFFTVEIPGLNGNNEHYIVYYGTTDPVNLAAQTPFLKEMIEETYAYDRVISAGRLFS